MTIELIIDDTRWVVETPQDAISSGKLTWKDNRPGIWFEFRDKKPKFIRAKQTKYGAKK